MLSVMDILLSRPSTPPAAGPAQPASAGADHHTRAFRLHKGQVVSFDDAGDALLRVSRGRLWVTLTGRLDDYFVAVGEVLRVPGKGRVVCEGDSDDTTLFELVRPVR